MAILTFDKFNRVIQVEDPDIEITVQDLVNQIRNYEDELDYMDYPKICDAFGKQSLGGGTSVGITLQLLNDWRVAFEARPSPTTILCTVSGGNLVATNQYSNNPIKPTAFTQVVIAQSSSATIIAAPSDDHVLYLLASLRGKQRGVGSYFYWNPTSGDDTKDGTTPGNAVLTFAQAKSLASAGAGDTIFCLATNSSGTTTVTERLIIDKANLKVMGPGHTFQLAPTATDLPTVQITAANVEISGLYIKTATTGTQDAISVTANNAFIQDSWIANVRGNGINVSGSARTRIESCVIEHCGASGTGDGIKLGNTTTEAFISRCIIFDNINGISLAGTGLADNIFENNLIYQNTTKGLTIGSGVLRTHVRSGHTFNKNGAGESDNTQNLGTDTFIESSGAVSSQNIIDIVDGVWDEVISGHLTAGTAGRTLRDAKSKATLASLK